VNQLRAEGFEVRDEDLARLLLPANAVSVAVRPDAQTAPFV
jgi:hypothetical protein